MYIVDISYSLGFIWKFPDGLVGKESACSEETQAQHLGQKDSPEKGMAAHSSILAWRIPWTEESGGLQPIGLQESDTTKQLDTHTHTHTHRGYHVLKLTS